MKEAEHEIKGIKCKVLYYKNKVKIETSSKGGDKVAYVTSDSAVIIRLNKQDVEQSGYKFEAGANVSIQYTNDR